MKNTAKVKYPKYDQEKVVKDMQDRMWRAIEGCTMEEYFDKVRKKIEGKEKKKVSDD